MQVPHCCSLKESEKVCILNRYKRVMIALAGRSFQADKGLQLRKSAEDKKKPHINTSTAVNDGISLFLINAEFKRKVLN